MPARNNPMMIIREIMGRSTFFLLFLVLSIMLFYNPLELLVKSSLDNELYSHIILIPMVSLYLIFTRWREIFQNNGTSFIPGSIFIVVGVGLYFVGGEFVMRLDQNDFLSMMTFAAGHCWVGGVVLFSGLG